MSPWGAPPQGEAKPGAACINCLCRVRKATEQLGTSRGSCPASPASWAVLDLHPGGASGNSFGVFCSFIICFSTFAPLLQSAEFYRDAQQPKSSRGAQLTSTTSRLLVPHTSGTDAEDDTNLG